MNLLLFNLATDRDDPILGFTTDWINRLAAHFDHIDVVTMRAGRLELSANVAVWSVGKEHGYSEARRAAVFYRLLAMLRARRRYAACFAHMMPLFAVMGAPLLPGVPITLWYTHRQAHRVLQMATAVSRRVVTAAPDSFPLRTAKLRPLGHGIDTDFFAPAAAFPPLSAGGQQEVRTASIVHVARLMPIKHQATLLRALPAVPDAHAVFVGDVLAGGAEGYKRGLLTLAGELGIDTRVTFAGAQPPEGVRAALRGAQIAVNLSPAGLFDKAALESMAVAVPTVVSSAAFDPLLGDDAPLLRIPDPGDHAALAGVLRGLLALPETQRAAMGTRLRSRVVAAHSLDVLIPRLVRVLLTGEPD